RSPDARRLRRLKSCDERLDPQAMISSTALVSGEWPARWTSTSSPFGGTRQSDMELAPTARRQLSINRARCCPVPMQRASSCRMARVASSEQRFTTFNRHEGERNVASGAEKEKGFVLRRHYRRINCPSSEATDSSASCCPSSEEGSFSARACSSLASRRPPASSARVSCLPLQ